MKSYSLGCGAGCIIKKEKTMLVKAWSISIYCENCKGMTTLHIIIHILTLHTVINHNTNVQCLDNIFYIRISLSKDQGPALRPVYLHDAIILVQCTIFGNSMKMLHRSTVSYLDSMIYGCRLYTIKLQALCLKLNMCKFVSALLLELACLIKLQHLSQAIPYYCLP